MGVTVMSEKGARQRWAEARLDTPIDNAVREVNEFERNLERELYAARAAGLALCARWSDEAEALAGTLGLG